jgi:hypothetical protein
VRSPVCGAPPIQSRRAAIRLTFYNLYKLREQKAFSPFSQSYAPISSDVFIWLRERRASDFKSSLEVVVKIRRAAASS